MALFRPYKHEAPQDPESSTTPRLDRARTGPGADPSAEPDVDAGTEPEVDPAAVQTPASRRPPLERKDRPTPSRRDAEAARRERLRPTLSKKEARRRSAAANRSARMEAMANRDASPAKELLRDHIDARFTLGTLLLPALLLIVVSTFLQAIFPRIIFFSTVAMYVFILLVVLDVVRLWRSFTKLAAQRGIALERGLKFYAMNRSIQIRRMRLPKPRVQRGDSY